jgi:hypothetical protein
MRATITGDITVTAAMNTRRRTYAVSISKKVFAISTIALSVTEVRVNTAKAKEKEITKKGEMTTDHEYFLHRQYLFNRDFPLDRISVIPSQAGIQLKKTPAKQDKIKVLFATRSIIFC